MSQTCVYRFVSRLLPPPSVCTSLSVVTSPGRHGVTDCSGGNLHQIRAGVITWARPNTQKSIVLCWRANVKNVCSARILLSLPSSLSLPHTWFFELHIMCEHGRRHRLRRELQSNSFYLFSSRSTSLRISTQRKTPERKDPSFDNCN